MVTINYLKFVLTGYLHVPLQQRLQDFLHCHVVSCTSMKRTVVEYVTPLYKLVCFDDLTSSYWNQTLPDDNLDLYTHFSEKSFRIFGLRSIFTDCGSYPKTSFFINDSLSIPVAQ